MSQFTFELVTNPLIVLAIVAAACAFAIVTYRQTLPPVSRARRWTLIGLRTLGIALLLVALFEPVISFLDLNVEEPRLLVAIDDSRSMTLGGQDSARLAEARAIARRVLESAIGDDAVVVRFADSAVALPQPPPIERLQGSGGETRLDLPFSLAGDSLRNRHIACIVLLSDGRFNAGTNPLYDAEALGLPVYAVGFGDSVPPRDLSVQQIFTNEVAYVGTELPVEVTVRATGLPSGLATVTLRDDNGIVGTQQLPVSAASSEMTTTFLFRPRSEGTARLVAQVAPVSGELTAGNNARSAFIRVRSNKRRYVLIAGGPSPDLAFVRRHLERDRDVTLQTFVQRNDGRFIEGEPTEAVLRAAEAVILLGYPTRESTPRTLDLVRSALAGGRKPLLVLLAATTDVARLRALEAYLPVTLGPPAGGEMLVETEITESGTQHPATRLSDPAAWSTVPPIYRTETQATPRTESEVLATARLGQTPLGEPLIVTRRVGQTRSMIVLGYGLYRWQLIGEGTRPGPDGTTPGVLSEFIGGSLRWLGTIEDERRVRIATTKQLYNPGEPVRFYAQVYDENYEPISDATVTVTLDGPSPRRAFALAPGGSGRYEAVLTGLRPGSYQFDGTAVSGGRTIGSDAGRFDIGETELELLDPAMNAELLRALVARTGGRFYTARETGTLIDDIQSGRGFRPRTVESRREFPLWSHPWVLAAALLAFAIEWTLRKRSGML